ncbi:MAG TPA: ABC transporter permease, partial [Candidatus Fraserbacteria bacterium]|nr:ABC transporter permease [Candidatus Fraserbacteria bacterium]
MLGYILRRLLYIVPLLLLISVIAFLVVKIEPGNFCTPL